MVLALFAGGFVFGIITAVQYPELMARIVESFGERFGDEPALDINLAKEIFLQNLTATGVAWVGGLLFGLVPIIAVALNGFILGYVATFIAISTSDVLTNLAFLAAGLIPHAIFELPAFLLAGVSGLVLGLDWLSADAQGQRGAVFKYSLITTIKYFVVVILALIVAAIIEVFVSGQLVNNFA